jgi:glycosyltransferase involved in cell wall biosynthesis
MYKAMLRDSCVIVLGDSLIQDLRGNVDTKNMFVLPNAIKNEVSEKEIKKVFSSRAKKEGSGVLFLSNMDKSKGWMKLLEACSMLNNKNINFKCSFAGAWPSIKEESEFLSYVKENGLSEVVSYVGKVDSVDKNILLKKSNILVFPTEYKLETFGRVIIEGMMFGLPVIANSIATIPSIIDHKKTGLLLNNNTPKEIADCIEYLLKNQKMAISMGIAGRKRFLDKFEISEYKKSFIKILNRIK